MRAIFVVASLLIVGITSVSAQSIDIDALKKKPIATGGAKVGELLRQWWAEGTAAGNAGDFYDNRDGDHSPLNLTPYPQLSVIKYSADDIKLKKHWAAQRTIVPHVTFGNSSTSAPAHLGGSNPRSYYVSQFGLSFLFSQYTKNNLYLYPEHRDHDPGHNGRGPEGEGHGDLYPTNTPYLIISQGSSGSDQPFMRMLPGVLAAFRPEVKKKLVETGTLMPTIQMLLRSTNKHLKDPKEYLTAKAHPSVFEGSWVDELALVKKAHDLELNSLPPMVQLRVLEEDKAVNGIDYIEPYGTEVIADTPGCIARVHRSKEPKRRLVVSAGGSFDVNKSKLTYTWVVLRGDPHNIKIVPKKDDASVAEITVAYHERRPIAPGSAMESNRVDIGLFVHNGTHYSAPGFVTFCTLDREARHYNERGILLDIAHTMGETQLRGSDWNKLLKHIANDALAAKLLNLTESQQGVFDHLAEIYEKRTKATAEAQAELKNAEAAQKAKDGDVEKAKKDAEIARKRLADAQKSANELLDRKIDPLGASMRRLIESRLLECAGDPLFTHTQRQWIKQRRTSTNEARLKSAWQKLVHLGIAQPNETLTPLLPGKELATSNWTRFERAQLEHAHSVFLAELAFPGMLQVSYQVNYVDHRLSAPREWRDVLRFDARGEYNGWMRYSAEGIQMFNHEGLLVIEKDDQGRCRKGRMVRYVQPPSKEKWMNANPLRMTLGDTIVTYEFDGPKDARGRRAGAETITDSKK